MVIVTTLVSVLEGWNVHKHNTQRDLKCQAEMTRSQVDIVLLNDLLETEPPNRDELRTHCTPALWTEWLWQTDATSELSKNCLVNRMHLLGLIIARTRAVCTQPLYVHIARTLRHKFASVVSATVPEMTLRELVDTVNNIQILWKALIDEEDIASMYRVIDSCFHRFGVLALKPRNPTTLDNTEYIEEIVGLFENGPGSATMRRLSLQCIRHFTSFFFVAYRHLHLAANAVVPEASSEPETVFEQHLVSAAMENFYPLSMYSDLNMANVLHYRHEFSNMYHSISQVVYYNNTSYERKKQPLLADVQAGKDPISSLTLFMQLYPEQAIYKEDEMLPADFAVPGSCEAGDASDDSADHDDNENEKPEKWAWFIVPERIYLISSKGLLYYSKDIWALLNTISRMYKVI
jgi:hypothetical protein